MPWLTIASTAANVIGHSLNRRGGRGNVNPNLADTSFIDRSVAQLRGRSDEFGDRLLRTANAGTGFSDITQNRMGNAMGMPAGRSMLEASRVEGFEMAGDMAMQNRVQTEGQVASLMNTRANMEMQNAAALNNAEASNTMMARHDMSQIGLGISSGILGFAGQRRDDQRFDMAMSHQDRMFKKNQALWDRYLANNKNPLALAGMGG